MIPKEQKRLVSQGLYAYQDENYFAALELFEEALGNFKDDNAVRMAAAYSANRAEKWENAADHWQALSTVYPDRPDVIRQYVTALLQAGRLDEAEEVCLSNRSLMQGDPPPNISYLVTIYTAQGRTEEAAKLFRSDGELT